MARCGAGEQAEPGVARAGWRILQACEDAPGAFGQLRALLRRQRHKRAIGRFEPAAQRPGGQPAQPERQREEKRAHAGSAAQQQARATADREDRTAARRMAAAERAQPAQRLARKERNARKDRAQAGGGRDERREQRQNERRRMPQPRAQQRERHLRGRPNFRPQAGEVCSQFVRTVGENRNTKRGRRAVRILRAVCVDQADALHGNAAHAVGRIEHGAQVRAYAARRGHGAQPQEGMAHQRMGERPGEAQRRTGREHVAVAQRDEIGKAACKLLRRRFGKRAFSAPQQAAQRLERARPVTGTDEAPPRLIPCARPGQAQQAVCLRALPAGAQDVRVVDGLRRVAIRQVDQEQEGRAVVRALHGGKVQNGCARRLGIARRGMHGHEDAAGERLRTKTRQRGGGGSGGQSPRGGRADDQRRHERRNGRTRQRKEDEEQRRPGTASNGGRNVRTHGQAQPRAGRQRVQAPQQRALAGIQQVKAHVTLGFLQARARAQDRAARNLYLGPLDGRGDAAHPRPVQRARRVVHARVDARWVQKEQRLHARIG